MLTCKFHCINPKFKNAKKLKGTKKKKKKKSFKLLFLFFNAVMYYITVLFLDQQVKVLCDEGASLDRYLKGRHPPRTPEEIKKQPKGYKWRPIEYEGRTCLQYLAGRVGADYSILRRIFAEFTARVPNFRPKSIFDFGSGVGTVPW
jgi:hypothetical protein